MSYELIYVRDFFPLGHLLRGAEGSLWLSVKLFDFFNLNLHSRNCEMKTFMIHLRSGPGSDDIIKPQELNSELC